MTLIRITDAEAVSMSRFLVQRDGLFLGSSSACNLVACIKLVKKMGWSNGEKVVTVLCVNSSCLMPVWTSDLYRSKYPVVILETGITPR